MKPYKNELYHYGVLGMKWGVRRYQRPDGTRTALGKQHEKESRKSSPTHEELLKSTNAEEVYKHRDKLSDRELRERVNRIQTEQQLQQLVENSRKQSQAKKTAKKVLDKVGNMAVTALAGYIFKNGKDVAPKVLATLGAIAVSTAIGEELVDAYNSLDILSNMGKKNRD